MRASIIGYFFAAFQKGHFRDFGGCELWSRSRDVDFGFRVEGSD